MKLILTILVLVCVVEVSNAWIYKKPPPPPIYEFGRRRLLSSSVDIDVNKGGGQGPMRVVQVIYPPKVNKHVEEEILKTITDKAFPPNGMQEVVGVLKAVEQKFGDFASDYVVKVAVKQNGCPFPPLQPNSRLPIGIYDPLCRPEDVNVRIAIVSAAKAGGELKILSIVYVPQDQ